ncbi:MAG: hypothetical protein JWM32_2672 [Verrucomicrobia bacterium]|nr:hypothetical protein [Verrucomicrobiota bacterium]
MPDHGFEIPAEFRPNEVRVFPAFTEHDQGGYFARLCTRWINQAAVNTDTA